MAGRKRLDGRRHNIADPRADAPFGERFTSPWPPVHLRFTWSRVSASRSCAREPGRPVTVPLGRPVRREAGRCGAGRHCSGRHVPDRAVRWRMWCTACRPGQGRGRHGQSDPRRRSLAAVGRRWRPWPLSAVSGSPRAAAGHDRVGRTPLWTLASTGPLRCPGDAAGGLRHRIVHTAFTRGGAARHLGCLRSLHNDTSRGRTQT